jgi:uncharacterized oligopeptide transporter (OPT) family protein
MTPPESEKKFRSYVPDKTDQREFTFRAVLIGLVLTGILGAANAYLGLPPPTRRRSSAWRCCG